jgi:hypothetical protein
MQNPDYVVKRIWESLGESVGQIADRAQDIAAGVIGAASKYLSGITRHLEPKIEYLKANWRGILKKTAWGLVSGPAAGASG